MTVLLSIPDEVPLHDFAEQAYLQLKQRAYTAYDVAAYSLFVDGS